MNLNKIVAEFRRQLIDYIYCKLEECDKSKDINITLIVDKDDIDLASEVTYNNIYTNEYGDIYLRSYDKDGYFEPEEDAIELFSIDELIKIAEKL